MKFLLGKKKYMTQHFLPTGAFVPVTVVEAGPCVVTQVKNTERDGYVAIQIGFGKRRHLSKALAGHLKDRGAFRWLREFRSRTEEGGPDIGTTLTCALFATGEKVAVTGTGKGKGFQGVVKRHHFHGHPASHGHKDQLRMPGSIGSRRQRGGVIERGKRMAGHMGDAQLTVKNLEVLKTDAEHNELWLKGAVPGARNSLVLIRGK
ncbi:50S ribosomal protein L3 [Candidatus Uhrbacteria bacterium]|nr:50S ribosomal protein L3 [Candidatus Uhrbacteria bacterium]